MLILQHLVKQKETLEEMRKPLGLAELLSARLFSFLRFKAKFSLFTLS